MHFILQVDLRYYYFTFIFCWAPKCHSPKIVIDKYEVKDTLLNLEIREKSNMCTLKYLTRGLILKADIYYTYNSITIQPSF